MICVKVLTISALFEYISLFTYAKKDIAPLTIIVRYSMCASSGLKLIRISHSPFQRDFIVIQNKFRVNSHHPALTTNGTINHLAKNQTSIDFFVNVTKSLPSLYGSVAVSLIRSPKDRFVLFNKNNTNLCAIMRQRDHLDLLGLITVEALKVGYLPKNCPPVRPDLYHVKNFSINPDIFPTYTPEAKFEAAIQLLTTEGRKKILIMDIVYDGEFRYKRKPRLF